MLLVLVLRIHKSIKRSAYPSVNSFDDQNKSRSSGLISTSEVISSKLLHSWVHPQSTLPPSLIQVLTSSTAERGELNNFRYLSNFLELCLIFLIRTCTY